MILSTSRLVRLPSSGGISPPSDRTFTKLSVTRLTRLPQLRWYLTTQPVAIQVQFDYGAVSVSGDPVPVTEVR